MKKRAFTLAETMITSAVLLIFVGMAALAVMSYLRSYRTYTEQGLRLRLAAKTLEVACFHLRSAESLSLPLPIALSKQPLQYVERGKGPCSLAIHDGKLLLQESGKTAISLGPTSEIQTSLQEGFLVLKMTLPDQVVPLETQISLRGIHR